MIGDGILKSLTSGVTNPKQWFIDWASGGPVAAGVPVSESTAMNYSAAWAATRVIAESVACLPPMVYRRKSNGGRERQPDHGLWKILHDVPNDEMDSYTYHEMQTAFVVNWGNAYAIKIARPNGEVVGLYPVHPQYVTPVRQSDNSIWYEIRDRYGGIKAYKRDEILHITGPLSEDGITGKGVIRQARESIGLAIATEKFESTFFGKGAFPAGVIEIPGRPSETAMDRIRTQWQKRHGGVDNAGRVAVLPEDAKYKQIGWPLEDLQFLGLREFSITEMSRWYRVPPHMLSDLTRATFSNIEEQGLEFLTYTLLPWIRRIEHAYNAQLLYSDSEYYVEFLMDALGRAKTSERAESNKTQFMHGALTLDQWCEMENRNPVGGEIGSAHFVPVNLVPAEKLFEEPEPEPEPEEPIEPEQEDEEEPTEEESEEEPKEQFRSNQAVIDACYLALIAEIDRLQNKESKRLDYYAQHPDRFLPDVETFYAEYRGFFISSITPALDAFNAAMGFDTLSADQLADIHISNAMTDILQASECQPEELRESISGLTAGWCPAKYMEEMLCLN